MPDAYRYAPLEVQDIRLVHVCKGVYADDIRLSISHDALPSRSHIPVAEEAIGSKVSEGWQALRTPEGQPFFLHRRDGQIRYRSLKSSGAGLGKLAGLLRSTVASRSLWDQQHVQYDALSYAWDAPERECNAFVMDALGEEVLGVLKVTQSLDVALRNLRSTERRRTLWVDAVSINQEDVEERSTQVLRMGSIYAQASKVVVWLGCGLHNSSMAFDSLRWLGQQIELADSGWWYQSPEATMDLDLDQSLPLSTNQWNSIRDVLSFSWFRRLWVIQEISLGNADSYLQCGQDRLTYHDLRRALAALVERAGVPNELSYIINDKSDILYALSRSTVTNVLATSRQHLCSAPRDKVYGMIGFLGPRMQQAIQPSYSGNFEEVYKSLFETYCKITDRLDLLSQCYYVEETDTIPSWLPDWRAYRRLFRRPDLAWQAAGMSRAEICSSSSSMLRVVGLWQDTVVDVQKPAREDDQRSLIATLSRTRRQSHNVSKYVTGESMLDVWSATLTVGAYHERMPSAGYDALKIWQAKILRVLELTPDTSELANAIEALGDSNIDNLECMSYFETSHGHVGFGPTSIRPGDRICILLGLFSPLIVRPVGNSRHRIMGSCYTHGLMTSEALLGPLPKSWRVEQPYLQRRHFPIYVNDMTGHSCFEDPRLDSLPSNWRRIDLEQLEINADDPVAVDYFRTVVTGETINYDPRMTKEALLQRGVKLETIEFV